jgi:hypothetical protein
MRGRTSWQYRGHSISYKGGMYWALGKAFSLMSLAMKEIDKQYV